MKRIDSWHSTIKELNISSREVALQLGTYVIVRELVVSKNIILGVVTALLQRLLFTSEVHVACSDMHNGSGAAPVLRG